MTICTSVDTIKSCAMYYFVNGGHCGIEFYMFHYMKMELHMNSLCQFWLTC